MFWVGRGIISKPELEGRGWNQFYILRKACMSNLSLLLGLEPLRKFVVAVSYFTDKLETQA